MDTTMKLTTETIEVAKRAKKQIAIIGIVGALIFLSGIIANAVAASKIKKGMDACANNKDLDVAYKTSWVLVIIDVILMLLAGGIAVAALVMHAKKPKSA